MKANGIIVMIMAAGLFCGCKGKTDVKVTDKEMAHGQYAAEKNPVSVMTLERTTFSKELICNGRLEAQARVTLQFQTQGTVASVNVRDGQSVQKGQVLASLDKEQPQRQLEQARLQYDKAEMTLADRLLDYGYTLSDTADIPSEQKRAIYINSGFLDAQMALYEAQRSFSQCELKAPFSGKASSVKAQAWEQAGQVCTLIDDSRYLVRFNVLETEYGFVHEGQKVTVSPFAGPDVQLEGSIVSVNPTVDQNGQIAVTAQVPGAQGLMDGMNVRIKVSNSIPDQLVVPKSAVVIRDGMEVLFRYVDGRSLWTYVNVLMSNSTQHVVEPNRDRGADLNVGDLIITTGNLNLGDDAPIQITE